MKKMPVITIKYHNEMTKTDVNAHNKRQQKLRDGWLQAGQTQEQVEQMFPFTTLEAFTSVRGYYAKFSGKSGGEWYGPFETHQDAVNVVGERAYETTFG